MRLIFFTFRHIQWFDIVLSLLPSFVEFAFCNFFDLIFYVGRIYFSCLYILGSGSTISRKIPWVLKRRFSSCFFYTAWQTLWNAFICAFLLLEEDCGLIDGRRSFKREFFQYGFIFFKSKRNIYFWIILNLDLKYNPKNIIGEKKG